MLQLEGVVKRFGRFTAVNEVSFGIREKGVVGLLGPNGAGKSTTLRLIAGSLMPTEGEIRVGGHRMGTEALSARRIIGYLPETPPLYAQMSVSAFLQFAARLRGLRGPQARQRALETAEECGVSDWLDCEIGTLSRGQRQRVGIAQAIVHDPKLLLLDEPTAGIDPVQLVETRRLIQRLGDERVILLSTHNLSEVESLCREILLIQDGRLIAQKKVSEFSSNSVPGRLRVILRGPSREIAAQLARLEGVRSVWFEAPYHVLDVEPGTEANVRITRLIADSGWELLRFESSASSLEDAFLQACNQARR